MKTKQEQEGGFNSSSKEKLNNGLEDEDNLLTFQAVEGIAVCAKQTGLPCVVVVGSKANAENYIQTGTSMTKEQFRYLDVNVVIGGAK